MVRSLWLCPLSLRKDAKYLSRYLIDSITLSESEPRPPHEINEAPVNPSANADAVQLYDYLRSIYGSNILSGQQDLKWADWVEEQTGKAPALVSVDLSRSLPFLPGRRFRRSPTYQHQQWTTAPLG